MKHLIFYPGQLSFLILLPLFLMAQNHTELDSPKLEIWTPHINTPVISGDRKPIANIRGTNDLLMVTRKDVLENTMWVGEYSSEYYYDGNGNHTLYRSIKRDGIDWVNFYQIIYEYDVYNNITMYLRQSPNESDWKNSSQTLYEYDNYDNITMTIFQDWNGSDWKNNYRSIYEYDSNNNLSISIGHFGLQSGSNEEPQLAVHPDFERKYRTWNVLPANDARRQNDCVKEGCGCGIEKSVSHFQASKNEKTISTLSKFELTKPVGHQYNNHRQQRHEGSITYPKN